MGSLELDHLDELTNQTEARADVQELLLNVLEWIDLKIKGSQEIDLPQLTTQLGVVLRR